MNQDPNPRTNTAPTVISTPLDADALVGYMSQHATPKAQWRIGLEYELIGFDEQTHRRIDAPRVQALLRSLAAHDGVPQLEDHAIVSLHMPYGDITLEPGGQIELSGFPQRMLSASADDLQRFLSALHAQARDHGIMFLALGFDPLRNLDEQSWIRKQRYAIMRPYLGSRGGHAWDMMTRTAAMQVSIDYEDLDDLGRKYVLGNRLGPIIAAMFANSPYAGGVLTGLKSTRYAVWLDVDPDRTGPGPGSLGEPFDLREAASLLMTVPAFFVEREGELVDRAGQRLTDMPDASVADLRDLLSMIFTEARIREYVEMRSADGGDPDYAVALMALWRGLTLDTATLKHALSIAPRLDRAGYRSLQMAVAKDALDARCEGVDVLSIARDVVSLALAGLLKHAPEEVPYLDTLAQAVIEDGVAPADILMRDCGTDVARAMQRARVA